MNWYIGQDIVAIVDHSWGFYKKGSVYTIKGLQESHCKCDTVEIDIGVTHTTSSQQCGKCNISWQNNGNTVWFGERGFAPLDHLVQISEITEVLKEPVFQ